MSRSLGSHQPIAATASHISARRRSPPDIPPGLESSSGSTSRGDADATSTCLPFTCENAVSCSLKVSLGDSSRRSGRKNMPARDRLGRPPETGLPSRKTTPNSARVNPRPHRSRVVFPHPFRPMSRVMRPGHAHAEALFNTVRRPNFFPNESRRRRGSGRSVIPHRPVTRAGSLWRGPPAPARLPPRRRASPGLTTRRPGCAGGRSLQASGPAPWT